MFNIPATSIAHLIEAHLEHDDERFMSWATFIMETYEKAGEDLKAKIIRNRLDGSYKTNPKLVVLDDCEETRQLAEESIKECFGADVSLK